MINRLIINVKDTINHCNLIPLYPTIGVGAISLKLASSVVT